MIIGRGAHPKACCKAPHPAPPPDHPRTSTSQDGTAVKLGTRQGHRAGHLLVVGSTDAHPHARAHTHTHTHAHPRTSFAPAAWSRWLSFRVPNVNDRNQKLK